VGLIQWKGEYVSVTGVPTIYENKNTKRKQLQIVIERRARSSSRRSGLAIPVAGAGP